MLYPHKPVFNYPGSSQIAAGELANKIIAQARDSGIDIIEHHPVRNITPPLMATFKSTSMTRIFLLRASL